MRQYETVIRQTPSPPYKRLPKGSLLYGGEPSGRTNDGGHQPAREFDYLLNERSEFRK